jgi:bacteriocin-like protein
MNTLIQPQREIELTDEQLASISGGIGHDREEHEHDRGRWDDNDRRGRGDH